MEKLPCPNSGVCMPREGSRAPVGQGLQQAGEGAIWDPTLSTLPCVAEAQDAMSPSPRKCLKAGY